MAASFLRPSRFGGQDYEYLESRFSRHARPARLAAMWLLDVRQMRKIEQLIVGGDDETVMAFKGSQIGAVGMTAVASAIVSQLSSTTLQIHALSNVNWTASAFIIAALLFSVLATMLSCIQQQILGSLNESHGVRIWLSNGSASRVGAKDGGDDAFTDDGQGRYRLRTSVASLLLLRLPNTFLLSGVTSFLLGFGLFLGFAWWLDLDDTPSRDSNLKVMIMYIVVGSVTFLGAAGVVKWKMGEVDRAEMDVGKDIEDGDDDDGESDCPDDVGDGGGEDDSLLRRKGRRNWCLSKEGMDHERIANALENAARAHRELAKLMKNAVGHPDD